MPGDTSAAGLISVPAALTGFAGGQILPTNTPAVPTPGTATPTIFTPAQPMDRDIINQNLELQHIQTLQKVSPVLPQYVPPPVPHGYYYPSPEKQLLLPTPDYTVRRTLLPPSRIQVIVNPDDQQIFQPEFQDIRKHSMREKESDPSLVFLKPDTKQPHSNYLAAFAAVYGDEDAALPATMLRTSRNVEAFHQGYRSPLAKGHLAAYQLLG